MRTIYASSHTTRQLVACLVEVMPVQLRGMALLERRTPGQLFPTGIDRAELGAAVKELVSYTNRAQYAASQLANLRPIPLRHCLIPEYGL